MHHLAIAMEELGMSEPTIRCVGKLWKVGGVRAANVWAKQLHANEIRHVREKYSGTQRLLAIDATHEMYAKLNHAILLDATQNKGVC